MHLVVLVLPFAEEGRKRHTLVCPPGGHTHAGGHIGPEVYSCVDSLPFKFVGHAVGEFGGPYLGLRGSLP